MGKKIFLSEFEGFWKKYDNTSDVLFVDITYRLKYVAFVLLHSFIALVRILDNG